MTDLVHKPPSSPALLERKDVFERLVEAIFGSLSPETVRAKRRDLEDFAHFLGEVELEPMARKLFAVGQGEANAAVMLYRDDMVDRRELSPATVNRRLSSVRSLVRLGRVFGIIPWSLEVAGVHVDTYRDTRGPGREGVDRMLAVLEAQDTDKSFRDRAIVHLLYDLALRRGEVASLDLCDIIDEGGDEGRLRVMRKGKRQRLTLTVPSPTMVSLRGWIGRRGRRAGPLFFRLDRGRGRSRRRLTGLAIYKIVTKLGLAAGVRARPHGLRHAAVTEALDRTEGDIRAAQAFAGHAEPRTTMAYDDSRKDLAGMTARLVAERKGDDDCEDESIESKSPQEDKDPTSS